jgi:hypothetical protein
MNGTNKQNQRVKGKNYVELSLLNIKARSYFCLKRISDSNGNNNWVTKEVQNEVTILHNVKNLLTGTDLCYAGTMVQEN